MSARYVAVLGLFLIMVAIAVGVGALNIGAFVGGILEQLGRVAS